MKGLDILKQMVDKFSDKRPILIYGDPDVDGLISLLFVCQFLDMLGKKYSYFVNEKRKHGFTIKPSTLSGYFVIAVDFEIKESLMQSLVNNNVAVLSLDHHKCQDDFIHVFGSNNDAEGVVLNNQYPFEPEDEEYQSGAGVVYEAFSEVYPEFKSIDREALVGITLLSDARPIENAKARKYLKTTFSADPQTGYIGYLIENTMTSDFGFGLPRMDRNFVDYTFSPRVNSLLRFGKENDAINFILGKGLPSGDTKERQSNLIEDMKARAYYLDMPSIKIIAVNKDSFTDYQGVDIASFIGLLCSKVKGTSVSALGFVFDNSGTVLRASFRGHYDDVNYLSSFQGLGIHAEGHPSAFGIVQFDPTQDTWLELNEVIGQLDENHKSTIKLYEAQNLTFTLMQRGMALATENCYVRDMFRSYIKYTGKNIKIMRESYRSEELTQMEIASGVKPDVVRNKIPCKYVLDNEGNRIVKYIEYIIDGKRVKSFGVRVEEGLILPILEKGHVQLYVREMIN